MVQQCGESIFNLLLNALPMVRRLTLPANKAAAIISYCQFDIALHSIS